MLLNHKSQTNRVTMNRPFCGGSTDSAAEKMAGTWLPLSEAERKRALQEEEENKGKDQEEEASRGGETTLPYGRDVQLGERLTENDFRRLARAAADLGRRMGSRLWRIFRGRRRR